MSKTDPKFQIEYQYQLYLERVGLKEAQMGGVQRLETRRAFYGACGQMLVLLREGIGAIQDEIEAMSVLEDMSRQIIGFFKNQSDEAVGTE